MAHRYWIILPVIVVFTFLVVRAGDVCFGTDAVNRRIETYNAGAELLDRGENERAAAYFSRLIQEHPLNIEIVEGLVETYSRRCMLDSVFVFLDTIVTSLTEPEREGFNHYLSSVHYRKARGFESAALAASKACAFFLERKDTLSMAVCMTAAAQSYILARYGQDAVRSVEEAWIHLRTIDGADRLVLETQAVRAEAYNVMDELAAADSLYRETLKQAREKDFKQVQAYCLTGLGRVADKRERSGEAEDFYSRALAEEKTLGSKERMAVLLNNLGQVESKLRNYDTAKTYLEESRECALSCKAGWILGYIYYGLGSIAELKDDRERALQHFQESYESHRGEGNVWGELGARLRVAFNLAMLGEYSEAIDHYEFCRERYEDMGSLYGLSWTLSGLAAANHNLGNFAAAESYYRQAYDVYEKLGNRKQTAWSLNSLGMVYDNQGRYREALIHEHEAMAIYEDLGDVNGIGTVHFSIGSVYFYLGNYTKSMEHYDKAFSIASEIGNKDLKRRVLSGMSAVYSAAGRLDLAGEFYHALLEEARASGDHVSTIWAINNLASFYIEKGRRTIAHDLLNEALSLIGTGEQDYLRARTLYLFGMSDPSAEAAIRFLEQALSLADENGLHELRWKCLTELGERYWMKGDAGRGRHFYDEAILAIESLRHGVGERELQIHMLRAAIKPYECVVPLIIRSEPGDDAVDEAFMYSERARAQVFASLLRGARFRSGRSEPDTLMEEERRLLARLSVVQRSLQEDRKSVV